MPRPAYQALTEWQPVTPHSPNYLSSDAKFLAVYKGIERNAAVYNTYPVNAPTTIDNLLTRGGLPELTHLRSIADARAKVQS